MNKNVSISIRGLRDSLVKFVNCGEYTITKELHAEINGIMSALDSLKLDYMFLTNSRSWRNQFNQEALKMDQASILNLMEKGEVMMRELMMHLSKELAKSLQENQIRKIHFIAKEKLRFYLKSIHPFSHGAYVRLSKYTMDAGLKDRYASIKNELIARTQEPQEPLKAWIDWTERTFPEQPGFKTPDWREHTYGLRHTPNTSEKTFMTWRYPSRKAIKQPKKVCRKFLSSLEVNNKKIVSLEEYFEAKTSTVRLDDEVRRYENRSSCTNKNESGNYFLSAKNFLTTPQNMMHQREDEDNEPSTNTEITNLKSTTPEPNRHSELDKRRDQVTFSVLSTHESPNRATVMSMRAPTSSYGTVESVHSHTANWRRHATEAGINLNVPGTSEMQYRYKSPVKPAYRNFVLNPQQDTRLLKRPFLMADVDSITTEYRQRLVFPDKNKIDKFPWIK